MKTQIVGKYKETTLTFINPDDYVQNDLNVSFDLDSLLNVVLTEVHNTPIYLPTNTYTLYTNTILSLSIYIYVIYNLTK